MLLSSEIRPAIGLKHRRGLACIFTRIWAVPYMHAGSQNARTQTKLRALCALRGKSTRPKISMEFHPPFHDNTPLPLFLGNRNPVWVPLSGLSSSAMRVPGFHCWASQTVPPTLQELASMSVNQRSTFLPIMAPTLDKTGQNPTDFCPRENSLSLALKRLRNYQRTKLPNIVHQNPKQPDTCQNSRQQKQENPTKPGLIAQNRNEFCPFCHQTA